MSEISVIAWGKTAEGANGSVTPGRDVFVTGRLDENVYKDKQEQWQRRVQIVANEIRTDADTIAEAMANVPEEAPSDLPF